MSCISCGKQIPKTASTCYHCGEYQSKLKKNLRYLTTISGLIVFILSGIGYLVSNYDNVRKSLFPKESIAIHSINDKNILFSNNGDSPIYIEYIEFDVIGSKNSHGFYNRESGMFQVSHKINSGEFYKHNIEKDTSTWNEKDKDYAIVMNVTDKEWEYIANEVTAPNDNGCYSYNIYSINDLYRKYYLTYLKDVQPRELEVDLIVTFVGLDSNKPYELAFKGKAIVLKKLSSECENEPVGSIKNFLTTK